MQGVTCQRTAFLIRSCYTKSRGPGQLSRYSDSLRAGRPGDRIPVEARFSTSVQTASYTMGTGSFPGVKRPGRGVDYPPPSSPEVDGRVKLYICSPLWAFVACCRVNFTLPFLYKEYVDLKMNLLSQGKRTGTSGNQNRKRKLKRKMFMTTVGTVMNL